jgi:hypothetical protein
MFKYLRRKPTDSLYLFEFVLFFLFETIQRRIRSNNFLFVLIV